MIRLLLLLASLAVVGVAAEWLAELPGPMRLAWQGWEVRAAPGVLVLVLVVLALLLLAGMVMIRFAWTLPHRVATAWRSHRMRRGWRALEAGLVAAAGGDERGVRGALKGVQVLPAEAPLRLLLESQAAMLEDDSDGARAVFQRMERGTGTRLVALRGLVAALRGQGRFAQALDLAERAARRSLSPPRWALQESLDLNLRMRRWDQARRTVHAMRRSGYMEEKAARRTRGLIAIETARACHADQDRAGARRAASEAVSLLPDFGPVAAIAAEISLDAGRPAEAARIVRTAWRTRPHPDLAPLFLRARGVRDPLAGVGPLEELIELTPDTIEGHLALAEVAMGAKLYGVARKYLDLARERQPDERAYRMLADLERISGNRPDTAAQWLSAALEARPAPTWTCRACAEKGPCWQAVCDRCGSFDRMAWGAESARKVRTPVAQLPDLSRRDLIEAPDAAP